MALKESWFEQKGCSDWSFPWNCSAGPPLSRSIFPVSSELAGRSCLDDRVPLLRPSEREFRSRPNLVIVRWAPGHFNLDRVPAAPARRRFLKGGLPCEPVSLLSRAAFSEFFWGSHAS